MFYKKICSATFAKKLKDIYKYATKDLNGLVGWNMVLMYLSCMADNGEGVTENQEQRQVKIDCNQEIKSVTLEKYTVFYGVNHDKKEIYLLYLLYRKYEVYTFIIN